MPTYNKSDQQNKIIDIQMQEDENNQLTPVAKPQKPKQKRRSSPAHAETMKKHKIWEKSPRNFMTAYADGPSQKVKIAMSLLEFEKWGKVDTRNIEALKERFHRYLQYCIENDMVVSNLNAYASMGISKVTAHSWSVGDRGKAHQEFMEMVKRVCAAYREQAMAEGVIQPVTGIWWQKNFDGFVDNQVLTVQPANPMGDELSPEELQKRIEGNVIVDEDTDLD